MFVANLCVYKSMKKYIQEKQVLIIIYSNFWEYVLSKFQISEHIFEKKVSLIVFR